MIYRIRDRRIEVIHLLTIVGLFTLLQTSISCQENHPKEDQQSAESAKKLADRYCSSCHNAVEPAQLPKDIWRHHVLPHMGHRLGIYGQKSAPDSLFRNGLTKEESGRLGIYPEHPILDDESWLALQRYFLEQAPVKTSAPLIEDTLPQLTSFTPVSAKYTRRPPLTSMIKILPDEGGLMLGDGKKNVNALIKLDSGLNLVHEIYVKNAPIEYIPHEAGALLLSCGRNIYPTDRADGELEYIYSQNSESKPNRSDLLFDALKRPVHVSLGDLNQDGETDYVISEFGHLTGRLSYYMSHGDSHQRQILVDRPGAIKTQIIDVDRDGWEDIVVLMTQGKEEIRVCYNNRGDFKNQKTWLSFSPLFGSTSFTVLDWNGDEQLDILYTCGDNADLTVLHKDYHGIYLYEHTGPDSFEQVFFYPLPGTYKAIPYDFDADGDLDIAAIAYFPDYAIENAKSFVYLDNLGQLDFEASTISAASTGRWMVMDAGDIDLDGDIDLALGSFIGFYPTGADPALYANWIENGPSSLVLKNNLH